MPKTQSSNGSRSGNFIERAGKVVTGRSRPQPVQNAVLSKGQHGKSGAVSPAQSFGVTRVNNPGLSPTGGRPAASFGTFGAGYTELSVAGMAIYGLSDSAGIPPELVGHLWQGYETRNGRTVWAPVGPDADEVLTGLVLESIAYAEEHPVAAGAVGFGAVAGTVAAGGAAASVGLGVNRAISRGAQNFMNADLARRNIRGGGGGSPLVSLTRRAGQNRYQRYTLPIMDMY